MQSTTRKSRTQLRAEVAMRREDLRIARKHRDMAEDAYVAAAGTSDDKLAVLDMKEAARSAQMWAALCLDKLAEAREAQREAEERGS